MRVEWGVKNLITDDLSELNDTVDHSESIEPEIIDVLPDRPGRTTVIAGTNSYYGSPIRKVPVLNRALMEQLLADPGVLERLGQKAGDDAKAETIRILEEEGVTQRKVAQRLNESLDAQTQEAKLCKDGTFAYSNLMVDNKTRLDAVKLAAEMTGMKEVEQGDNTQVLIIDSFNIEKSEPDKVEES